jgi:hypothetical protein
LEIAFVLIFSKVKLGPSVVQGVHRPRKILRVANLRKSLKYYCYKSAQGQKSSTLRRG